jgi:hypothetical protein
VTAPVEAPAWPLTPGQELLARYVARLLGELVAQGGHKVRAAEALGMPVRRLDDHLARLGLQEVQAAIWSRAERQRAVTVGGAIDAEAVRALLEGWARLCRAHGALRGLTATEALARLGALDSPEEWVADGHDGLREVLLRLLGPTVYAAALGRLLGRVRGGRAGVGAGPGGTVSMRAVLVCDEAGRWRVEASDGEPLV